MIRAFKEIKFGLLHICDPASENSTYAYKIWQLSCTLNNY